MYVSSMYALIRINTSIPHYYRQPHLVRGRKNGNHHGQSRSWFREIFRCRLFLRGATECQIWGEIFFTFLFLCFRVFPVKSPNSPQEEHEIVSMETLLMKAKTKWSILSKYLGVGAGWEIEKISIKFMKSNLSKSRMNFTASWLIHLTRSIAY